MKIMKWIYLLVFCLFIAVTGRGQISANDANTGQNEDLQQFPELLPADSGYIIYTYDDGTAENYCAWQLAGNMNAVKFRLQPYGYSASIVGARVFVGDGSYPAGGNILNQPFLVSVYASDGENSLPGTLIDSISATITNYGWVKVTGLNAFVTSDFYISITQLSNSPDCIPIGVDETAPKVSQSYARNVINGNPWVLSPYQDLMINALISTNVGMDEPQASEEIKIYPNPANESVNIVFSIPIKTITLKNSSGQILLSQNISNQPASFINTSSMLSGIYFISFDTAIGDSLTRKLVVLH